MYLSLCIYIYNYTYIYIYIYICNLTLPTRDVAIEYRNRQFDQSLLSCLYVAQRATTDQVAVQGV